MQVLLRSSLPTRRWSHPLTVWLSCASQLLEDQVMECDLRCAARVALPICSTSISCLMAPTSCTSPKAPIMLRWLRPLVLCLQASTRTPRPLKSTRTDSPPRRAPPPSHRAPHR